MIAIPDSLTCDLLLASVADRNDARRLDHKDGGASECSGPMHDPFRNRAGLMPGQRDRFAVLDIDQQLAVEDEEEFVLVVVLVPMEISIDDPQADDGIVDGRKRLVEPRLVGRRLGRNVDKFGAVTSSPGKARIASMDSHRVTTTISVRPESSSMRSSIASTKPSVAARWGRTVTSKCAT